MKISKIVYLSLFIISISLIFAFCLKTIFFSSNKKTILETNTKYFDEIYSAYKKMNQSKEDLLTEKQFLNIFHCFFVISQLELIDYGEIIIYILEKKPILIENFMLESKDDYIDGFKWFSIFDEDLLFEESLFQIKEDQPDFMKKFEKIKSEIRKAFKDLGNNSFHEKDQKLTDLKKFNELRNDIKAIFKSTSLNIKHLQNLLPLFDICITNKDILIIDYSIIMKPALFFAIDFIKLNWSKTLSTDMTNNVFLFKFTTSEGAFSYFYISLYSWIQFFED